MLNIPVLKIIFRELVTFRQCERVPEPDLVMDNCDKATAYRDAGQQDHVMDAVYLFHAAQICEVIKPGDTVLDLGCGPATQLCLVAQLNPDVNFVGLDLSRPMLELADKSIRDFGLANVELGQCDICDLASYGDQSVDAVVSTMSFHHLPDQEALMRTFREAARVLKMDGGLYLTDFGRLKSQKSMAYFASKNAHRQSDLFTKDYFYSLNAAFSLEDYRGAARYFSGRAKLYRMYPLPFMITIKSVARRSSDEKLKAALGSMRSRLTSIEETDLSDMRTVFRFGGMRSLFLD